MAELIPAPFKDLVTRLFREPALQDSLFELPKRRWYVPNPDGPDLTVRFHSRLAGNPAGPAAGPHTQMAQNILLSYVAGARILELKTVQVDDHLTIPRPCIDMTNIGYNVEWSQELRVEDSLREYVAGAMLIEMYRHAPYGHGPGAPGCPYGTGEFTDPAGEFIFDISVGYDLAGIRSEKVQRFLDGMRDAKPLVERLRMGIPSTFAAARDLHYRTRLSDSVTLSTFHGCPANEIERICEFLIGERDFDVIVKMNPPMLGKQRLEHLLHDVLGYHELRINPKAYTSGLAFDEAVQICDRLSGFAKARNRRLGFKFSNTLEVIDHRDFFSPDNEIMYLSGQPLHVITMALTDEFRRAVGPDVPISFSAGLDQFNFPIAVACGFVPVTISTDLLRPGGYGRLPNYLKRLVDEMNKVHAGNIDEYILKRFGLEAEARQRVLADVNGQDDQRVMVRWAQVLNTSRAAELARDDPRYRADRNRKVPKRIDSHLVTFDCISCDKCLPVCPNAANFTYPTPLVAFDYHDLIVEPGGQVRQGECKHFEITEDTQIACYADFCNECGNCDTFCPEYGGPYIKKPSFFGRVDSWRRAAPRDGFVVQRTEAGNWMLGRYKGHEYELTQQTEMGRSHLNDGTVEAVFSDADHSLVSVKLIQNIAAPHALDVGVYHTMRHLLAGVMDARRINQVNVQAGDS